MGTPSSSRGLRKIFPGVEENVRSRSVVSYTFGQIFSNGDSSGLSRIYLLKYRIFDDVEILIFSQICSIRTKSKATGPLIKKGFGSLVHKL